MFPSVLVQVPPCPPEARPWWRVGRDPELRESLKRRFCSSCVTDCYFILTRDGLLFYPNRTTPVCDLAPLMLEVWLGQGRWDHWVSSNAWGLARLEQLKEGMWERCFLFRFPFFRIFIWLNCCEVEQKNAFASLYIHTYRFSIGFL